MRGFLLDTNVLSELRKPKRNANVVEFVRARIGEELFVAELCFAEIRIGIEDASDRAEAKRIQRWLDSEIRPLFGNNILTAGESELMTWCRALDRGRRERIGLVEPDGLIGAVASAHQLIVASRDWRPFRRFGVPCFDPWRRELHLTGVNPITIRDLGPTLLTSATSVLRKATNQ